MQPKKKKKKKSKSTFYVLSCCTSTCLKCSLSRIKKKKEQRDAENAGNTVRAIPPGNWKPNSLRARTVTRLSVTIYFMQSYNPAVTPKL